MKYFLMLLVGMFVSTAAFAGGDVKKPQPTKGADCCTPGSSCCPGACCK